MYQITLVVMLLAGVTAVQAETRGILVEVTPAPEVTPPEVLHYRPGRVNIYSDEKTERKHNISIAEATEVLKAIRGHAWRGETYIDIVFHDAIVPEDLIAILEGIKSGNRELEITYIGRAESSDGKIRLRQFRDLGPG